MAGTGGEGDEGGEEKEDRKTVHDGCEIEEEE